jgi:hypothetical protein
MRAAIAFLLLLVLSAAAGAQTATGTGTATSTSVAGAGASSGSQAAIYQSFSTPAEQRIRQNATIRNTPDAHAPAILGGTNPCVNGASLGGAGPGFGFSIGASWNARECERRNLAVLAHQMGNPALAQEILCGAEEVRAARALLGQPCIADVARAATTAAITPAPAPIPVSVVPTAPVTSGPSGTRAIRPEWCYTASPRERQTRRECG